MGELLDLLGPGSTEHERLSIRSNLFENLLDLRLESHVEHSVGFVENEVGDSSEVRLARLDHVDESSRSSDDNFGSSLEISNLLSFRYTTVDALHITSVPTRCGGSREWTDSTTNSRRRSEFGRFLVNLNGEFSSRRDDEDDRSVSGREEGLGVDVNHGGESEGDGLSGTSSRNSSKNRKIVSSSA